ncbi:unnamed protein product, partial [Closterium sp. NIES-54]
MASRLPILAALTLLFLGQVAGGLLPFPLPIPVPGVGSGGTVCTWNQFVGEMKQLRKALGKRPRKYRVMALVLKRAIKELEGDTSAPGVPTTTFLIPTNRGIVLAGLNPSNLWGLITGSKKHPPSRHSAHSCHCNSVLHLPTLRPCSHQPCPLSFETCQNTLLPLQQRTLPVYAPSLQPPAVPIVSNTRLLPITTDCYSPIPNVRIHPPLAMSPASIPSHQPTSSVIADLELAGRVQQMTASVADQIVKDSANRASYAEMRLIVLEKTLGSVKDQAASMLERMQLKADVKTKQLQQELEEKKKQTEELEARLKTLEAQNAAAAASGGVTTALPLTTATTTAAATVASAIPITSLSTRPAPSPIKLLHSSSFGASGTSGLALRLPSFYSLGAPLSPTGRGGSTRGSGA